MAELGQLGPTRVKVQERVAKPGPSLAALGHIRSTLPCLDQTSGRPSVLSARCFTQRGQSLMSRAGRNEPCRAGSKPHRGQIWTKNGPRFRNQLCDRSCVRQSHKYHAREFTNHARRSRPARNFRTNAPRSRWRRHRANEGQQNRPARARPCAALHTRSRGIGTSDESICTDKFPCRWGSLIRQHAMRWR